MTKDYDLTNFVFINVKRDNSINWYENNYPISWGINTLKYQKKRLILWIKCRKRMESLY